MIIIGTAERTSARRQSRRRRYQPYALLSPHLGADRCRGGVARRRTLPLCAKRCSTTDYKVNGVVEPRQMSQGWSAELPRRAERRIEVDHRSIGGLIVEESPSKKGPA